MEKQHALQRLEQLQKKLYAIHYACSAMNLDADTVAPKNTSEGRGVALGVLAVFFRLMFARREPSCVHPAGERNIEVTLAALSSCARAAAERDDRVMVEHVEARVQGSDDSHVRFKVEAIALDDKDVAALATSMQQRIEKACDTMLGTPGTTARVRFLPSKTTVQTVEVSGE